MPDFKIRPAIPADAPEIFKTGTVLGYTASRDSAGNILKILSRDDHIVFVAADPKEEIIGWVHAFAALRVASEPFVESGGLAVHEGWRKKGIGKSLMEHVIKWAKENGYRKVRVRMNDKRNETHAFYTRIGYSLIKNQHVYEYKITDQKI